MHTRTPKFSSLFPCAPTSFHQQSHIRCSMSMRDPSKVDGGSSISTSIAGKHWQCKAWLIILSSIQLLYRPTLTPYSHLCFVQWTESFNATLRNYAGMLGRSWSNGLFLMELAITHVSGVTGEEPTEHGCLSDACFLTFPCIPKHNILMDAKALKKEGALAGNANATLRVYQDPTLRAHLDSLRLQTSRAEVVL